MIKIFRYNVARRSAALFGVDILILVLAIAALQRYAAGLEHIFTGTIDLHQIATATVAGVITIISIITMGFYRWDFYPDRRSWILRAMVAGVLLAALLFSPLLYANGKPDFPSHEMKNLGVFIILVMLGVFGTYVLRSGMRVLQLRILLIGNGRRAANIEELARRSGGAVAIVRRIRIGETSDSAPTLHTLTPEALKRELISEVVVAVDDQRGLAMDPLLRWKLAGLPITDYLTFCERACGRVDLDEVSPGWFIYGEGCRRGWLYEVAKRYFDIAVSAFLLIATLPLLAICAGLIWLESGGPIFYRQERVGRYNRPFTLLKLRTMRTDAERAGRPQWALAQDPRTTRVGRILRRLRIDEIPQLWNVLRDDMSIIGPRPERPFFVDQLAGEIPLYRERHWVKPGITGWAQVNFSYGASVADAREKLAYDLYYLKNARFFLDLFIILATIRVILFQEGAR